MVWEVVRETILRVMWNYSCKAAFTVIYLLIIYTLLVMKEYINDLIYVLKPKFTNSKVKKCE